jgi:hypothetical protein
MQGIVNCGDVRVVQASLHLDFPHESEELDIAGNIRQQDLDGLNVLSGLMLNLKYLAHAARTKNGNDPVRTDVFANMKAHIRP